MVVVNELSLFTEYKRQKGWSKTREIYMLDEKIQNLAETDRGSYYNQEEWLEEFLDDKGTFYNCSESDDSKNDYDNYGRKYRSIHSQMFFKLGIKKTSQI